MSGTIIVPSIELEARAELRVAGPLHGFVSAGGRVALRRVTVTYQLAPVAGGASEELFSTAPASLWVGAGVAMHFSR